MFEWVLNSLAQWRVLAAGAVVGFVLGLAGRRTATRFILRCATSKQFPIVARCLRKLGRPAFWLYYSVRANAVIEEHIRNCRSYLRMHFADGEKGEIWLYNSDLNAFLTRADCKALYYDCVANNSRVTNVRILLRRDVLDDLVKTPELWRRIQTHLDDPEGQGLRGKLLYCFDGDFPVQQKQVLESTAFTAYTSNEGFIFYTRGTSLTWMEAVCVHRRLSGDGTQGGDLRITVTASRAHEEGDGFARFMRDNWQEKFEMLFQPGNHWKDFYTLVAEQAR